MIFTSDVDLKILSFTILTTKLYFYSIRTYILKSPVLKIHNFYLGVVTLKDKPTQRDFLRIKKDDT